MKYNKSFIVIVLLIGAYLGIDSHSLNKKLAKSTKDSKIMAFLSNKRAGNFRLLSQKSAYNKDNLDVLFYDMDTNGDGELDYYEVLNFMDKKVSETVEYLAMKFMNVNDTNKDGQISWDEFKKIKKTC